MTWWMNLIMTKRVVAALILAGIGIPAMFFGNLPYFVLITIFLSIVAWEYVNLFRTMKYSPSMGLTVGGVVVILFVRDFFPEFASAALALCILLAMTVHLLDYERGRDTAGTDFAVTVAGLVYVGWIGAYLLDLRALGGQDGFWYSLLTLGAMWLADATAYFYGSKLGKHKMTPRLSPKKSWEGYWAGVIVGTLGTAGLAVAWHALGGPDVSWWQGGLLGLVLSVVTTLGDLGESMLKRQAGLKDSSNIIPGHGGFFDRMDAWLWGGVIGYFLIFWFIH
jgi:phosphatidate cytidylyltransferase